MGDKRRLLEDGAQYPPTPRSEGRLVKGSCRDLLARDILLPFAAIGSIHATTDEARLGENMSDTIH